jgi:hypothetical protein
MRILGTDFLMFQVSDLARAAAFGRETLGRADGTFGQSSLTAVNREH